MAVQTFRDAGRNNSFYSFMDEYCLEKVSGHPYNRAFHRLCSLMRKMDVKTAVVEEIDRSHPDIIEECNAVEIRLAIPLVIRAFRIVFVRKKVSIPEELMVLKDEDFLSDTIVINVVLPNGQWRNYVYRAIVVKPRITNDSFDILPLLNNYIHVQKDFLLELSMDGGIKKSYRINGSFFCQQNQLTSVCAHASLLMTINNMNLANLPAISTEYINNVIGIDHRTNKIDPEGKDGLSIQEVVQVLTQLGLATVQMNFYDYPNQEYEQFVYHYIESKCPVLLAFFTYFSRKNISSHVVPVLGHTLNSDMWRPEAEGYLHPATRLNYRNTSCWVDHFIIHDDNLGMYFCLPAGALKRTTLPKNDLPFRAYHAIAVVPKNVITSAQEAEYASMAVTTDLLNQRQKKGPIDIWPSRLMAHSASAVVRTFLIDKSDYVSSLEENDFEGGTFSSDDKAALAADLPERFWLSEITLSDLYCANKSKIIDFFYDCNQLPLKDSNEVFQRWIQVRFPYVLSKFNKSGNPSMAPMNVKSHYPLIRGQNGDRLEW